MVSKHESLAGEVIYSGADAAMSVSNEEAQPRKAVETGPSGRWPMCGLEKAGINRFERCARQPDGLTMSAAAMAEKKKNAAFHVGLPPLWSKGRPEMIPLLITRSIPCLLLLSVITTFAVVAAFAAMYHAIGDGCFYSFEDMDEGHDGRIDYWTLFAFSLHTFTTLGYGSLFPHTTCVGAQLLVMTEFWLGVLVVSIAAACVINKFLSPSP